MSAPVVTLPTPEPRAKRSAEGRDASSHGTLHLDTTLACPRAALSLRVTHVGETVLDVALEASVTGAAEAAGHDGASPRAFEQAGEGAPWLQALAFTDRLYADSAWFPSLGYCLALERMLDLTPPARAQWLRVLGSEIARVADHWLRLGLTCATLGATTPQRIAFEARTAALGRLDRLACSRGARGWLRVGGFARAPELASEEEMAAFVADARAALDAVERACSRNRFFVDRLRDVAVLPKERCLAYSSSGPLLRAAGVARDLRKDAPHLVYGELDFDVPVGSAGDDLDRWLVVVEEIRQSLRIIEQASARLRKIGEGPLEVSDPSVHWPNGPRVRQSLDAMIEHFEGVLHGPQVPEGECYEAVESPNGELGFLLVSDGGLRPQRLRCRAPSFFDLQALPEMLRGTQLGDIGPTLALLNPIGVGALP